MYLAIARPSIGPPTLLRAMLLQAFYSARSERQLMKRMGFDLLFRRFIGLGAAIFGVDATPRRTFTAKSAAIPHSSKTDPERKVVK